MLLFNKPYLCGKELDYIREAVMSGTISGDGVFSRKCQKFLSDKYGFKKVLLTTSCTDALEMAAILTDIQPGDEVIVPSYTFVSTANAFVLRGAKIVFCDSGIDNPNIDAEKIERLVTSKTKVIVPVHYAGIACDMKKIMSIARKYGIIVVEDAAQAIDSYFEDRPLGSIGHLAAFSFHETKNIISGEGGMLVVNDERFAKRAEIIREKGTNRTSFFRGEVSKYQWVDIGSSFLPSDVTAAFLFAQLENMEMIQMKRRAIWDKYWQKLSPLVKKGIISLPSLPEYATNNGHIFYILCNDMDERGRLIDRFRQSEILAIFHYVPLHSSEFYKDKYEGESLVNADRYSNCLLRLPLFYDLTDSDTDKIVSVVLNFYK